VHFFTRPYRVFRAVLVGIAIFAFCIPLGASSVSADQLPGSSNEAASSTVIIPQAVSYSQPSEISIPKIKVNSPVKAMGLTSDNKMAVPDNFTQVGWYGSGGTIPGDIGNAVMGAHVDNGGIDPTIKGVFKNLHTLVPGDDIYITDDNGAVLHFKVIARKIYPYNTTATSAVFGPSTERDLNLITCYGTWLPKADTYNERLVVFARLVSNSTQTNKT
jgi:sortase (surface protein transpeptidase)